MNVLTRTTLVAIASLAFGQLLIAGTGQATFQPNPVVYGETLRIIYDEQTGPLHGAGQLYAHVGYDNWETVLPQDQLMNFTGSPGVYDVFIGGIAANVQVDVAFHDDNGTWDNNNGADWHAPVIYGPGGWLMDGQVDAGADLIAQNGVLKLYAGFVANKLYVAGADAGEGNDHFIFVAAPPGPLQAGPWTKAGQVAHWLAFLADENDNSFVGWFDVTHQTTVQAYTGLNGGWMEGSIRLDQLLGETPDRVWLTFAPFATPDGGALVSTAQCPPTSNGDGNVDAAEFVEYVIFPQGDMNRDRRVDASDIDLFVAVLLGIDTTPSLVARADVNRNGMIDGQDIAAFVAAVLGP